MTDPTGNSLTVAAHFRNRDDAHRAVIELREVDFPANTIGAAFREGTSPATPAPAILEPEKTAAIPNNAPTQTDPLLPPETPITTFTGGSPFGEASTYQPPSPATVDWWEGMRVALPDPPPRTTNSFNSETHPARELAEPKDINFEPADRPAPAYDNDYQSGDYSYETHTYDATSLSATLAAAGLDGSHADAIARKLDPGESIVTISTTDRADEAQSILTRNSGELVGTHHGSTAASTGKYDLRLYGELLRSHTSEV